MKKKKKKSARPGCLFSPLPESVLRVMQMRDGGRGLVASRTVRAGELLDSCPVLLLPEDAGGSVGASFIGNYVFEWDDAPQAHTYALALGLTSLCNHSGRANAEVTLYEEGWLQMTALRDIDEGEAVTIYYGDELWFDPVEDADAADGETDGASERDAWGDTGGGRNSSNDAPCGPSPSGVAQ